MNCPCEKCLTLGICKAQIKDGDLFDLLSLVDRCEHFRKFMFQDTPMICTEEKLKIQVDDYSYTLGSKITNSNNLTERIELLRKNLLHNVKFTNGILWEKESEC